MRSATDRAIDSWPVGRPFALLPSMYSLTLDVIIGAVFGVEEAGRAEELKRAMRAVLAPIHSGASRWLALVSGGRLGSARAARRFEERHRVLDRLIDDEIDRRRTASDLERRTDVLSTLLVARDEATGGSMSDEEVRDGLHHPPDRRPRDDGHRAGLVVRACCCATSAFSAACARPRTASTSMPWSRRRFA